MKRSFIRRMRSNICFHYLDLCVFIHFLHLTSRCIIEVWHLTCTRFTNSLLCRQRFCDRCPGAMMTMTPHFSPFLSEDCFFSVPTIPPLPRFMSVQQADHVMSLLTAVFCYLEHVSRLHLQAGCATLEGMVSHSRQVHSNRC